VVLQGDESDGRTNTTGDFVEESPSGAPQHTTDLPDILPDRDAKGGEIQGIAQSVGRYTASDPGLQRCTKTPEQVIGFVGMLTER
jgi:hypothetical protein